MRSMVEEAFPVRRRTGASAMRAPPKTFALARRLRREMTLPEVVLWSRLRQGRLDGLLFRRQHPIGPYVADFYCPAARLSIEIDGAAHSAPERIEHDARRDEWLAARGAATLRFAAVDVLKDERLEGVLIAIVEAVRERMREELRPS